MSRIVQGYPRQAALLEKVAAGDLLHLPTLLDALRKTTFKVAPSQIAALRARDARRNRRRAMVRIKQDAKPFRAPGPPYALQSTLVTISVAPLHRWDSLSFRGSKGLTLGG